jgi:hypothetical protein
VIAGLSASKNGAVINPGTNTKLVSMTGSDMAQATVPLTTASTQLNPMGSISGAPAAIWLKNLDATNSILISGETGFTAVFQLSIPPGQACVITPLAATLWAKSAAATATLLYAAFEA